MGQPEALAELPNGEFTFYPQAEEEYTIFYEGYNRPHVMTASTDTPIFNAQYHDLILFKALMKYAEHYNVTEIYKANETSFMRGIQQLEYTDLPKHNIVLRPFA